MSDGLACAICCKFMRVKKQGVAVEERMPQRQADGSEVWMPYKLWMADLCECPGCGAQILAGFGHAPVAEHYQPSYVDRLQRTRPVIQIDDCGGKRP